MSSNSTMPSPTFFRVLSISTARKCHFSINLNINRPPTEQTLQFSSRHAHFCRAIFALFFGPICFVVSVSGVTRGRQARTSNPLLLRRRALNTKMQSDDIVWQLINKGFCSFKAKFVPDPVTPSPRLFSCFCVTILN
jgi:hypothetical protein